MNNFPTSYCFTAVMLLLATVFTACEEKVEIALPEGEQYLVVQGWITDEDTIQTIQLTYTSPYFSEDEAIGVSNAEVILHDDSAGSQTLQEVVPGIYQANFSGISGHTYTLEVFLEDGEHYLSEKEVLKAVPPIDTIYSIISPAEPDEDEPEAIYAVLIETMEAPGYGDCYRWREVVNGEESKGPFDIYIVDDEFVNGNYIPQLDVFGNLYEPGDTVTVVQERISREAFEFLTEVQRQTAFVGGPFDPPPAPIEGNLKNVNDATRNALGFFGAAGRTRASIIVAE